MGFRPYPIACLIALAYLSGAAALSASDIDDFFLDPPSPAGEDSGGTSPGEDSGGSVLSELYAGQEKMSLSWTLSAGGGVYAGAKQLPIQSGSTFDHSLVGGTTLSGAIDLRPTSAIRIHSSSSVSYPGSANALSVSWLDEFFLDYALNSGFTMRFGKFGVSWGNSRILGVADLPGRAVNTSVLDPSVTIEPEWLQSPTPSLWAKAVFPLGTYSLTGLMSLPSGSVTDPAKQAYGVLNEYTFGKTYIGLGGFVQYGKTPRACLDLKTSAWGTDFYLDSCLGYREAAGPLFSASFGLYRQISSGPDMKILAEMRWNGESTTIGGLVGDALPQAGLAHAIVVVWSSVAKSAISIGGAWYHDWADGSGAVLPSFSWNIVPNVSVKGVFPVVYGDSGSYYVKNPPAEANGYALGGALMLVLSTSF